MKNLNLLFLVLLGFIFTNCNGQSPSATAEGNIDGVAVKVDYSSPRVRGREGKIYGELVPFGQVWRAGANYATEVSFDKPVLVEGSPLEAGTYSLFMIPMENEDWTVIFNKATGFSGTQYEAKKDQNVLEVKVTAVSNTQSKEELTYSIQNNKLQMEWEKMIVPINIKAAK